MTRRAPSTFLLMLLLVLPHATTVLTSEAASASPLDPEEGEDVNEVAVRLHQEVRLECVPPPGTASWRHDAAAPEADESHRYATLESGHLRISSVRLDDVGLWSCERRDPQTGRPLPGSVVHRLSVTEPPHAVYLEVDGRRLDPGNVFLPVWEGAALAMGCVAEGGVPPPRLSWRLLVAGSAAAAAGNAPLLSTQAPVQMPGNAHLATHVVRSEARVERLVRAHHNASVACLVQHPAMHPPAVTLSLLLDVQYSPSFTISRVPGFGYPLKEGIPVSLKCDVDSNPASSPVWVKDDGPPPVAQSNDGYLNFSAISREHVGWYKCTSRDASSFGYFLNVVYDDEVSEGSERASSSGTRPMADEGQQVEATLGSAVTLQCPGGACWRRLGTSGHLEPVGVGPELSLERVLYQEAGVYRCEADKQAQNQLDQRRSQLSVRLNVTGSPVVHPPNASVAASSGQRVTLRFEFCANPAADRAVWLLGSSLLKPGHVTDAVVAHNITEGSSPLCHEAALTLRSVTPADAGEYAFLVRSPRGLAEGSVSLSVMRASGLARAQHSRGPASSALLCCAAAILLSRA